MSFYRAAGPSLQRAARPSHRFTIPCRARLHPPAEERPRSEAEAAALVVVVDRARPWRRVGKRRLDRAWPPWRRRGCGWRGAGTPSGSILPCRPACHAARGVPRAEDRARKFAAWSAAGRRTPARPPEARRTGGPSPSGGSRASPTPRQPPPGPPGRGRRRGGDGGGDPPRRRTGLDGTGVGGMHHRARLPRAGRVGHRGGSSVPRRMAVRRRGAARRGSHPPFRGGAGAPSGRQRDPPQRPPGRRREAGVSPCASRVIPAASPASPPVSPPRRPPGCGGCRCPRSPPPPRRPASSTAAARASCPRRPACRRR